MPPPWRSLGAAVRRSSKQPQDLLRQLVGLGHHRVAGLLQDLCAAQVGGFRAKSASMMRLLAALWFSTEICRLAITDSKRDCDAPSVARSAVDGVQRVVDVVDHHVDGGGTSAVLSITARPSRCCRCPPPP
jgi:hypothetical protein